MGVYVLGWRGWRVLGSLDIGDGTVTCRVMTGAVLEHRSHDICAFKIVSHLPGTRRMLVLRGDAAAGRRKRGPSGTRTSTRKRYRRLALTNGHSCSTD